jgi:hypothetical protein
MHGELPVNQKADMLSDEAIASREVYFNAKASKRLLGKFNHLKDYCAVTEI